MLDLPMSDIAPGLISDLNSADVWPKPISNTALFMRLRPPDFSFYNHRNLMTYLRI